MLLLAHTLINIYPHSLLHTGTPTQTPTHTQNMLVQKYSSRIKEYKVKKVLTPFLSFFSLR